MERTIKLAIAFILLIFIVFEVQNAHAGSETSKVDTESLNIRSGPGLSYAVIGMLKQGDTVDIVSISEDWLEIKQKDDRTGWIASWHTTYENSSINSNMKIVSIVNHLNIRSGPSISSDILGTMNAGDEATVVGNEGTWARIVINEINGWVHTDYITEKKEETELPINSASSIDTFTVTVDGLNVRENPDLKSKQVASISKDESFSIIKIDGNWIQLNLKNDKNGWVYTFHGTLSSSTTSKVAGVSKPNTVTILSNGTNIRSGATTDSSIVLRANTGDKFTITSEVGEWYELAIPSGESAFVAKWVVSVSVENLTEVNTNSSKPKRELGTLKGLTIVIDPGHGGNDYGTIGANGTNEKEITLSTSLLLAEKLRAAGAIVYLTRDSDNYITLQDRVSVSHKKNADAFISVHYDATTDPSIKGFTTYYTQEKQKALATAVNNGLASTITLRNRGAQKANYLVLRENRQLAILIELGYLSNPSEEKAVATDSFRQQATDGIYKGLLEYFDSNID